MKIVLISNGLGILYKFRIEFLKELIKLNNKVYVLSPFDDGVFYFKEITKMGITTISTEYKRRSKNIISEINILKSYNKILKEIKPDIVLTYTIKPNIYGSLVCQKLGIPYINTITGNGTAFQNENLTKKIVVFLNKLALKKSKRIFFQNENNLKIYVENNIVDFKKTKLINGSGVNLTRFVPVEKIDNKKTIFLFIGRIMDEKGINEYLECAEKIKKSNQDIEFQVLGSFEEEKYREKILELDKNNIIKYLGESYDIRKQVKNVDCVINPSWHEGMSNVLLEAGAMKKFLIASEIFGCKEIVINNKTGFTFEVKKIKALEETILRYLSLNNIQKESIIESCYDHISKNFNRETIIEEYITAIKGDNI
ncbi:MAG: glycosyltransferase family 4 protein [Cetobacterium sp.]|uniref:glycosyltransferase family 4 protein n=1 Tax=Cetobacterium sp. TaxID=2071632 RepID=UPI003F2B75D0